MVLKGKIKPKQFGKTGHVCRGYAHGLLKAVGILLGKFASMYFTRFLTSIKLPLSFKEFLTGKTLQQVYSARLTERQEMWTIATRYQKAQMGAS